MSSVKLRAAGITKDPLFDDYAKHCAGGTLVLQEGIRVHWRIMEKMMDEIARDICKK